MHHAYRVQVEPEWKRLEPAHQFRMQGLVLHFREESRDFFFRSQVVPPLSRVPMIELQRGDVTKGCWPD